MTSANVVKHILLFIQLLIVIKLTIMADTIIQAIPRTIKIVLTHSDCKNKEFHHNEDCPIATCLKRYGYKKPYVLTYIVYLNENRYCILDDKGRGDFIKSLIHLANNGKKFKRTINLKYETTNYPY